MTVSSQVPYNAYTYAGSPTFVYGFRLILATDLQVSVAGVVQPSTNYTLSGVGNPGGGSILYTGSLTTGQLVELQRITVLQRVTDYQDEGDFLAATVNADYDRIWMALQEFQRGAIQSIRVPESAGVPTLPSVAVRANNFLVFDYLGNPTVSVPAAGTAAAVLTQLANPANGFGADMVGGVGRVVNTVAALKALVKTGVGKAFVLGYYAAGDGGGGQYYYDSTDTTSADNAGTIFVAGDGGRWKLSQTAPISAKQFGAKADGVTDDNTPLQAVVSWVNAAANTDRFPIGVYFPQGFYKYSGTLWFTRPVSIYAHTQATLNYTGASYAIKLGPDGLSGSNIQLNAEYTIDGLRFENCTTCAHVIYINEFITEPRIRNCTFVDCGNGTSYCIYGQYANWDAIVENNRLLVLNGTGGQNFIAFNGLARTPSGSAPYAIDGTNRTGYDGGNSRVTIRDCWMTALFGQQLGVFAYLNSVKSRIVGGGFQSSTYGIYLSGFASAVTIDTVYAELSLVGSQCFIYAESTNTAGSVRFQPENVTARNCYVNMHGSAGVTAPLIKTSDASMLFKGWRIEDLTITDVVTAQPLIVQNDTAGQVGNQISVRLLTDDTASVGKQYKIRGTYSNAENWATPGGTNMDVVGNVAYTFKQADVGRYKLKNGVTAVSWTLPNSTTTQIEVGSVFYAFHGGTTANLSLIADSGVTIILTGTATTGTRTLAPNGIAKCELLAANVYWVSGPGVT